MTSSYFYPISFYPKTLLKYRQYKQFIICIILSSQTREMCETAPPPLPRALQLIGLIYSAEDQLVWETEPSAFKQTRFYIRETISFKRFSPFGWKSIYNIIICWYPWIKKSGNYLSCIEGMRSMKDICYIS